MKPHVDSVQTDTLVVGGGVAGVRAAIEAKRQGVETLLVSKTPVGWANCSAYAGGGLSGPIKGVTPREFFDHTITAGKQINNQKLVWILANEAAHRLLELQDFGVNLLVRKGHCWVKGPTLMNGTGVTSPLAKYARDVGVKMLEGVMVLDILVDGEVVGALCLDVRREKFLSIRARSVVLATGGAGRIYQRTDNPVRTTGDGYALAYRLGIPLVDMEFVQFFPMGLAEPGYPTHLFPVSSFVLEQGCLRNIHGEDIAKKYGLNPRLIYATDRDVWTIAIGKEIYEGRGDEGGVLLDLRVLSEDVIRLQFMQHLINILKSFPIKTKPLHVAPLAHTFLGGIQINENCETNISGMYATGEVTGGVHGANRVGGNALTECIVFGARAGYYAAEYAKHRTLPELNAEQIRQRIGEIRRIMTQKPNLKGDPNGIKRRIQATMWRHAGIIRSEQSLQEAQRTLRQLEDEDISKLYATDFRGLMKALEALNMLVVAKIVVAAALRRAESRGNHYRIDYPQQNDDVWLRNIVITKKNDEMEINLTR